MKEIQITQGMKALIDDDDYESVSRYKWYRVRPAKSRTLNYAAAKNYPDGGRSTLLMHRLIINAPKGVVVDHIDGDGLNNQKTNLRLCTQGQNNFNSRINKTNTSGFIGVCPHGKNSYRAYISINNKTIHIGNFKDPKEAAKARNEVASRLRGEFAVLNPV